MKFAAHGSTAATGEEGIREAYEQVRGQLEGPADLYLLYSSVAYDSESLNAMLGDLAGDTPIHGGTSCKGVMSHRGVAVEQGRGLGLAGLRAPDGAFGVGSAAIDGQPKRAARQALQEALAQSGRVGEVPRMIWVTGEPGHEERFIEGLEELVGSNVPIMGGSAADNEVAGQWHQFANGEVLSGSLVVTVLFSSTPIGFSFHSGYEPTENRGTVTRAEGRVLHEIDGEPAAQLYNEWTEGAIEEDLQEGGSVLAKTTLHPLGRKVGEVEGTPYYKLSHPEQVTEGGALTLFTEVEEGEDLVCMTGTADSLTSRAGRVAEAAQEMPFGADHELTGALVTYCGGCMLAVEERLDEVAAGLDEELEGAPYLGMFTFGEQGCFLGEENQHANLMISVVTFYD
jgi:hypothetical protein